MKPVITAIVLCAACGLALAGAFFLDGGSLSRTFIVPGGAQTGTSTPPAALATVDPSAYYAKMTAIANVPAPKNCATTSVASYETKLTSTAVFSPSSTNAAGKPGGKRPPALPPCPKPLWPVRSAPIPDARAILPFERIVAYYGNFYSTRMGVLGEYPPDEMLAMLASTTAMWSAADPSTPIVPALDYIAVAAQAGPGPDGMYRLRMPASQIEMAVTLADKVNGLVFLDVQVGLSSVETEVPLLEGYLKLPNVELSLDPEFAMHDGARPGTVIGTLDASDINFAANLLAKIVDENHLPPKILVIHRFTQAMVTNTSEIKPLPEVEIVMDMDGFGSPAKKLTTYKDWIAGEPVQFTGFKLFYKNDVTYGDHLMTPEEVLRLSPQPSYIQYQ